MADNGNGAGNGETKKERLDRELIELLNELRVALPGVQVLFAFLLAVPFTQQFGKLTEFQQGLYFVSLYCTAMGSVLLIAPSSYHRLRFRSGDKEHLIKVANDLSIAGTIFLAGAMTAAVALITDLVFRAPFTIVVTVSTGLAFAWFWYGMPLLRRLRHGEGEQV